MWKLPVAGTAVLVLVPMMADQSKSDETLIRKQLIAWAEAWNNKDADAVAALYDQDADRTFAHGATTSGREQIRKMYKESFGASLPDSVVPELDVEILTVRIITDDVAVADYGYRATGLPIAPHLVVHGRTTVVMVKRDGVWLRSAQRNWIPVSVECVRRCADID